MKDTTTDLERTVEVTLNGETRTIQIARFTPAHCWFAKTPVICKFRTGTKRHTVQNPQVFEWAKQSQKPFGMKQDYFFGTESIHNRRATVIAWAEQLPGNSGWTNNEIK
jgi:hypothetical protein